jgi:hypothetical protein
MILGFKDNLETCPAASGPEDDACQGRSHVLLIGTRSHFFHLGCAYTLTIGIRSHFVCSGYFHTLSVGMYRTHILSVEI